MEDRPSERPSNVTVRSFVLQLDLFEVRLEPDGVRARPTGWLRFLPGIVATTWLTVCGGAASLVVAAPLALGSLVFGCAAAFATFARRRYRVAHGRLVHERRFAGWARREEFAPPAFAVRYATGSDGHERETGGELSLPRELRAA